MPHTSLQTMSAPLQHSASLWPRLLGALLLLSIAVVHWLDLPSRLAEVPYLGYMYIVLIIGVVSAALLLFYRPRAGWALGSALALGAMIGFVLNRTVGLPYAAGDIGNWGEPLGVASLVAEGGMMLLSGAMWRRRRAARASPYRVQV